MPQEIHIGHRSGLVSALSWLLLGLGVAGLLVGAWVGGLGGVLLLPWAAASIWVGQALLRRLPWSRRPARLLALGWLPWLLLGAASGLLPLWAMASLGLLDMVLLALGLRLSFLPQWNSARIHNEFA
ncbi:hypothetical protein ACG0Z6_12600 [Roseateles sp. BYS180W]|uniref:Uncharacterized protein n=1 Tax=Roseateles rivi TaxID=3299028 RepID=A0ABW7FXP2_9BURK